MADGYQGYGKIIVDEDRRVIAGASLVGQDVGELWHAVPSFPTMSEIWLRLLESYGL